MVFCAVPEEREVGQSSLASLFPGEKRGSLRYSTLPDRRVIKQVACGVVCQLYGIVTGHKRHKSSRSKKRTHPQAHTAHQLWRSLPRWGFTVRTHSEHQLNANTRLIQLDKSCMTALLAHSALSSDSLSWSDHKQRWISSCCEKQGEAEDTGVTEEDRLADRNYRLFLH